MLVAHGDLLVAQLGQVSTAGQYLHLAHGAQLQHCGRKQQPFAGARQRLVAHLHAVTIGQLEVQPGGDSRTLDLQLAQLQALRPQLLQRLAADVRRCRLRLQVEQRCLLDFSLLLLRLRGLGLLLLVVQLAGQAAAGVFLANMAQQVPGGFRSGG